MTEMQDRRFSGSFSPRATRAEIASDADDLALNDHGYTNNRSSSSTTVKSKLDKKISSDFESDDAFISSVLSDPSRNFGGESRHTNRARSIKVTPQQLLCKSCSTGDLQNNIQWGKVDHKIMFNNFIE